MLKKDNVYYLFIKNENFAPAGDVAWNCLQCVTEDFRQDGF